MFNTRIFSIIGTQLLFSLATLAVAQEFSIDWSTVDGGGGFSSGGGFDVEGTIGQHDAGFASGGDYSLESGFWYTDAIMPCDDDAACLDEDVCSFNFCDTSACDAFTIRYGDVAEPFGGLVQTSDILCAVEGFGNYSACPNADIAGCAPSGVPIGTNDILAVVAAFGGDDPCGCSGLSAASGTADATTSHPHFGAGHAVISLVPQSKVVSADDLLAIDVFVSNASDVIGYEIRANKAIKGLTFDSVSVNENRRDYAFARTESIAALDQELGRIGGVTINQEMAESKEFYAGTIHYRVDDIAENALSIALDAVDIDLFRNTSELIDIVKVSGTTIEVEPSYSRRASFKR